MTPTTVLVPVEELLEDWNSGQYTTLTLAQKHGLDRSQLAGHIFRQRKLGHPFKTKGPKPNTRPKKEKNKEQIKKPQYLPSVDKAAFAEKTKIKVEMLNVDLFHLEPNMCRWPIDNDRYCGLAKMTPYKKSSGLVTRPAYCEHHQGIHVREVK